MTAQQLIGTALRLLSVWLVLTSIAYFSSIPGALAAADGRSSNALALAFSLGGFYVLAALLLWFFPMSIAQRLVPRTHHTNTLSFRAHELARVGCALMGLWLFSKALPSLAWVLFRSFMVVDGSGSSFSALGIDAKLDVAVSFFELAFALLVIIKAKTFARIVSPEPKVHNEEQAL